MAMNSAFMNCKLGDEIYVEQVPCFTYAKFSNHVHKLDKKLHGLKMAPRTKYEILSKFLVKITSKDVQLAKLFSLEELKVIYY